MNNVPRQKLREIVATYGLAVCDEPRRCKALLSDLCGEYNRENRVLITALEEGVAAELLNSATSIPYEVRSVRLAKRLYDNQGIAQELAAWAVESWALALGVIASEPSERQNAKIEQRSIPDRTLGPQAARKQETVQEVASQPAYPVKDTSIPQVTQKQGRAEATSHLPSNTSSLPHRPQHQQQELLPPVNQNGRHRKGIGLWGWVIAGALILTVIGVIPWQVSLVVLVIVLLIVWIRR